MLRALVLLALMLSFACTRETPGTSAAASEAAPETTTAETTTEGNGWRQPLFDGLGDLHLPITTNSETAQRYFDQGLALAFAFNHAAADFAFTEAATHDPDCGMC
jgi:hypothetical protein